MTARQAALIALCEVDEGVNLKDALGKLFEKQELSDDDRSLANELAFGTLRHREEIDSDVCHIGKILRIDDEYVSLLEIDPDAEWGNEAEQYRISEITRLDFGGKYEEALLLVGGKCPRASQL